MTTTAQPPITDNPELWLQDESQKRIALFDILLVIARGKKKILLTGLVFACLALVYALAKPRLWESTVTILPPEQQASRGMASSMQDLSMALASSEGVSFKSSEDFWAAVLKTRSVAYEVIQRFDLQNAYKKKSMIATRAILADRTNITTDKAGLLNISVQDTDRYRAMRLANGYVQVMHDLENRMSLTDAGQRALFFRQELDKEKDALVQAEYNLAQVERKTGVISLGSQTSEAIRQVEDLRAQITEKEVELQSMGTVATNNNPEVKRLQGEIAAEKAQLAKTEGTGTTGGIGDIGPQAVPGSTLEYIRAARDIRFHETLYEALLRQLEASRMDEARDAPVIQIIDPAVPAEKHSGVGRGFIVIVGLIIGLGLGLVWVILSATYQNLEASPENGPKLRELKRALGAKG